MKVFEFRLESVLRVQERRRQLAELRRQQAQQVLVVAEAEVERLQHELRRTGDKLEQVLTDGAGTPAWEACFTLSRWLGVALTAAEGQVRTAADAFGRAHEAYRQCATAVEVLRHLRQQRWREHKDEIAALEQQRIEEIVLRRWTIDRDDPDRKDVP